MKTTQELYGVLNAIRVTFNGFKKATRPGIEGFQKLAFAQAVTDLMPRIEQVLANAEKANRLFLVIHTHDAENVSTHIYFSEKDLTERQVCQRLGIQYNPKAGEELSIREIPNIPTI